jgi:serine/threonine-protein kinase
VVNALIDGRYLLLTVIGSGGEARVYRARDEQTGNEVAVRLTLQPRVRTEIVAVPSEHPGWVQLLDSGHDPQHGAYQVFELLEGRTLGQIVLNGPLEPAAWRSFVDQSLAAVEALHATGWVHGDLNADNFIQTTACWKLLELPFLRLDPPEGRSAMFGSIYTLAPEQINGAKADAGSDLYALGCLYYYAASGAYPHTGTSDAEIAISRLRFEPEPLGQKTPRLPVTWSDWVMKLIAPKAKDRFPSATAARQLLGVA